MHIWANRGCDLGTLMEATLGESKMGVTQKCVSKQRRKNESRRGGQWLRGL